MSIVSLARADNRKKEGKEQHAEWQSSQCINLATPHVPGDRRQALWSKTGLLIIDRRLVTDMVTDASWSQTGLLITNRPHHHSQPPLSQTWSQAGLLVADRPPDHKQVS